MRTIKVALKSRKLFRNWISAGLRYLLFKLGLPRSGRVSVVLPNGSRCLIDVDTYGRVINAYYDGLIRSLSCDEKGLIIDFMGIKFRDVFRSMIEVFIEDQ